LAKLLWIDEPALLFYLVSGEGMARKIRSAKARLSLIAEIRNESSYPFYAYVPTLESIK
jgi:hypothetical protein